MQPSRAVTDARLADAPWLETTLRAGATALALDDDELSEYIELEADRQANRLAMVASCSIVDPSVLACLATPFVNVTAEGYPGRRYHAGCELVDRVEQLAIERAQKAFGARYANVQPHSATTANQTALAMLLHPGDRLLGMELKQGGHLTHGSKASFSGQYYSAVGYGVASDGHIDYAQVEALARECKPRLIICGATAYSRHVDFERFRAIADAVGAWLLADISHVAGLVIAGLHPSPIDHAHITTTCTHKQLFGPRGGLILLGRDAGGPGPNPQRTLAQELDRAVFPFSQGAPIVNAIAAKARALQLAMTPQFRQLAHRIAGNAEVLARQLAELGYSIVAGGTQNHIVLVDLTERGVSGLVAERALEECHIVVNKNAVPSDHRPTGITSGVRIGTNTLAYRGLGPAEMRTCALLIDDVLRHVVARDDRSYELAAEVRDRVRTRVGELCDHFPIPGYAQRRAR